MPNFGLDNEYFENMTPGREPSRVAESLHRKANNLLHVIEMWREICRTETRIGIEREILKLKGSPLTNSRSKTWTPKTEEHFKELELQWEGANPEYLAHDIRKFNDQYEQMAKEVLMRGALFWTEAAVEEFLRWQQSGGHSNVNTKRKHRGNGRRLTRVHCEHTNPISMLARKIFSLHLIDQPSMSIEVTELSRWLFRHIVTAAITQEEKTTMDGCFKGTGLNHCNPYWNEAPFRRYKGAGITFYRLDRVNKNFVELDLHNTTLDQISTWFAEDSYYGQLDSLI